MSDKYQNKYRIPSARLQSWDYSSNAAYFITICASKRELYFGQITNGKMELAEQGKMANHYWLEIPNHFSFVLLDEFVVMPNHIHGIIIIDKPENYDVDTVNNDGGVHGHIETGHALSLQHALSLRPKSPQQSEPLRQPDQPEPPKQHHPRFRNQGKNTISAMVGSYKSVVTKRCNENKLSFGWQSRFHDHIIRDNDEYHRIKNYIVNNPANWEQDKFFKNDS